MFFSALFFIYFISIRLDFPHALPFSFFFLVLSHFPLEMNEMTSPLTDKVPRAVIKDWLLFIADFVRSFGDVIRLFDRSPPPRRSDSRSVTEVARGGPDWRASLTNLLSEGAALLRAESAVFFDVDVAGGGLVATASLNGKATDDARHKMDRGIAGAVVRGGVTLNVPSPAAANELFDASVRVLRCTSDFRRWTGCQVT